MATDDRKITCSGHFGDVVLDKKEFIQQWLDHGRQLSYLDLDYWVAALKPQIEKLAANKFEKLYALQNLATVKNQARQNNSA